MNADECYPFGMMGDPLTRKPRTIDDAPAEEVYAVIRKLEQHCQKKAYETHREEFYKQGPDISKVSIKCPIKTVDTQYALIILVQGCPVKQDEVYQAIMMLCSGYCPYNEPGI